MRGMPTMTDGAAAASGVEGLEDRLGETDDLEHVVGAATAGGRLHLADGVAGSRIDEIGGADLLGRLALHLDRVDGEDTRRAGDAGALDDGLADTTAADDGDRRAGLDLGRVESGADAGGDATADEGELVVGQVGLDLHDHRLSGDHLVGERAETGHAEDVRAVGANAAVANMNSLAFSHRFDWIVQAVPADATCRHERSDDLVADLEIDSRRRRPAGWCRRPRGRGSPAAASARRPWRR